MHVYCVSGVSDKLLNRGTIPNNGVSQTGFGASNHPVTTFSNKVIIPMYYKKAGPKSLVPVVTSSLWVQKSLRLS